MDCSFRWCTHHLGIQDANDYSPVHHGSGIHRAIYEPKGGHPIDGHVKGGPRKWPKRQGHSPTSALYRIRRQQRSTGTNQNFDQVDKNNHILLF